MWGNESFESLQWSPGYMTKMAAMQYMVKLKPFKNLRNRWAYFH